jgi:hypothetical protein
MYSLETEKKILMRWQIQCINERSEVNIFEVSYGIHAQVSSFACLLSNIQCYNYLFQQLDKSVGS